MIHPLSTSPFHLATSPFHLTTSSPHLLTANPPGGGGRIRVLRQAAAGQAPAPPPPAPPPAPHPLLLSPFSPPSPLLLPLLLSSYTKLQVTLFSAPNYCGEFDNAGGMMSVDETLMCSFQVRAGTSHLIIRGFIFLLILILILGFIPIRILPSSPVSLL